MLSWRDTETVSQKWCLGHIFPPALWWQPWYFCCYCLGMCSRPRHRSWRISRDTLPSSWEVLTGEEAADIHLSHSQVTLSAALNHGDGDKITHEILKNFPAYFSTVVNCVFSILVWVTIRSIKYKATIVQIWNVDSIPEQVLSLFQLSATVLRRNPLDKYLIWSA